MSEEYSDQIFDYLTAEMLNGPSPPDLSARIEAAWAAEKDVQSSGTRVASNIQLPSTDNAGVSQPPVAPPVQVRKESFQSAEKRSSWIPALTASAALLVAAIAWTVWPEDGNDVAEGEGGGKATRVEDQPNRPSDTSLAGAPSTNKTLAANPGSRQKQSPKEELNLDNLPFSTSPNGNQPERETQLASKQEVAEPLEASAIVDSVNQQFAEMWAALGVQSSNRLAEPLLKNKILLNLIGAESLAETSGSLEIDPDLQQADFVEQLMNTPEAASLLAEKLASALVVRNPRELEQADGAVFTSLASEAISDGQDWNAFIQSVLEADLSAESKRPLDVAAKFVYRKLAVGDKHRMMNRLGSNLLNTNTSCVRCHDSNSSASPTLAKQESYWSMVALLNGVQVRRNADDGSLNLTDKQSEIFAGKQPVVYYTLPDGQVLSATAKIPGAGDWDKTGADSPRAALAAWVADSTRMDQAVVNQTWKMLFGRHLVPQVRGIDVVAIPQRQAVLDMLAAQYRAHGRDVRSLVTWLASTDLYAQAPISVSRQQWLEESDEAFEKLQLAELAFAVPVSLGIGRDATSLASSLDMMNQFSGSSPSLNNLPTTLAQPNEEKPGKGKELVLEMPSASFIVHRSRPTAAELSFVDKLLGANELSWAEKVDHVVSLFPAVNGRPRDLDNKLLEYHDGDAKEALITLLWAVKNNAARSPK